MTKDVKYLLNKLIDDGYEAYVVGGCVRDTLLGKEPKDWDIVTSATYDEIMNCLGDDVFEVPIMNAKEHNICFVKYNHEQYEIATYRIDGEYTDHRHTTTEVTNSLEKDLSRRDFTINAMAMDINGNIIDLFTGREDLNNGIIRAVGNAKDRINEDALRILRAYRFSSVFGFELDPDLKEICENKFNDVFYCSAERRRDEINKLLNKREFNNKNSAKRLLSIVTTIVTKDMFEQLMINYLPIQWAVLLQNKSTDDARFTLENYKFDNKFIKEVMTLLRDRKVEFKTKEDIKRYMSKESDDRYKSLRAFQDVLDPEYAMKYSLFLKKLHREIIKNNEPYKMSDLKVNGNDLLDRGYEGKEIGDKLNDLLNVIINNPKLNKKDILLSICK